MNTKQAPASTQSTLTRTAAGVGVLFDLDGVLLDTERSYTRIWEAIDRRFPTGVPDLARRIKGTTLSDILARYYPDQHTQAQVKQMLRESERDMEFHYMPAAQALLSELKERGVPTALVTSSDDKKLANLRRAMPDIFGYFDAVVDGSMVTRSKPDPEPYLLGASLIGVPPFCCAVFEDAINGLQAGLAAGAYTLGMTDTLGREAIEGRAEEIHDSLAEVDVDGLLARLHRRALALVG